MKKGEFVIQFEEGLHARPAADLVKICTGIDSEIQLVKEGMNVNPKSILGIMALGAAKGDTVSVEIDGSDEEEGFKKIEEYFKG